MTPLFFAAFLNLTTPSASAAEVVPVYGFSFLGGQYFFAGDKTKLNMNLGANAAPVVKLAPGKTILPLYTGAFRGTKGASDPVGSGTLFSQSMNHRVGVTYLRDVPGTTWRLKPSVSYRFDFLKETRDEKWGRGLFDSQTVGAGFEAENTYKAPFSYRIGYDFFYTRFPNYNSLESKSGFDPTGSPLGRESAGVNTLDTVNQQVAASITAPYPADSPKVAVTAGYRLLWQKFLDQPLVNAAGQYMSENRQDFLHALSLSVVHPREVFDGAARLSAGMTAGFNYQASNQNTYDATRTTFIPDAYSYRSFSIGPTTNLAWGDKENPTTAGLAFIYSNQSYFGRLTQTGAGAYTSDYQSTDRYTLGLSSGFPIAKNFRLIGQANFLWADSNQRFEQSYRYTYASANYLLGFSYDY